MTVFFGNGSGSAMADRRYEMAVAYLREGDFEAAGDLLVQGIEIAPSWPPLHFYLGEALRKLQRTADAQRAFESYLALDPADTMGAGIKLALMGATTAPDTMSPAYVAGLFDQYAPRFEKSLVEKLGYQTPELIYNAVMGAQQNKPIEAILDLGCGTGLAAALFEGKTEHITGVDISAGMVAQARARNIYTSLHVEEIAAFLERTKETYDLVLSADVFVYAGSLDKIFILISGRLWKDGLFAFSVQTPDDGQTPWTLGQDHRYAHSPQYIESCLKQSGIDLVSRQDIDLRRDGDSIIRGQIYLCRKS